MTETKAQTADAFREIANKGVAQAKVNFDKAKAATDEGTDLFKNSYATAAKGPQATISSSSKSRAPIPTPPSTTPMPCWA